MSLRVGPSADCDLRRGKTLPRAARSARSARASFRDWRFPQTSGARRRSGRWLGRGRPRFGVSACYSEEACAKIELGKAHRQASESHTASTGPVEGARRCARASLRSPAGSYPVAVEITPRSSVPFEGPHRNPGYDAVQCGAPVVPENRSAHCVRDVTLTDDEGRIVARGTVRFRVVEGGGGAPRRRGDDPKKPRIASVYRPEAPRGKGTRVARTAM